MSKEQDYIQAMDGAERRFVTAPVEMRAGDSDNVNEVTGYAFKFNTRANIAGLFEETISPEVRDDARLLDDVRCLFNHNPSLILARSKAGEGTLRLSFDDVGLRYSYTTPDRTYARDLEDAIQRGDVDQSSFAFWVQEETWEERKGEMPLRTIRSFDKLIDVSPVTYPAYPDATVGKRSMDAALKENIPAPAVDTMGVDKKNERTTVRDAQLMLNKNKY